MSKTRTTWLAVYFTLAPGMTGDELETSPETHIIPARHRREAMDWSLVLLSQGIESTVTPNPETRGWRVEVDALDRASAEASIRAYERENRAWPFRHSLPWAGFAFDWSVLAWVGLIAALFAMQSQSDSNLEDVGICNVGLVRSGQWWRPVTATMLHADLGHLAMNAVFGFLLLGIAMGRFGSGLTLLAATACGTMANILTTTYREEHISGLGASGVVMAALGLLAADASMQYWRRRQPPRLIAEGIVGGLMLFILVGVSPTSDVAAHAFGFFSGLLSGLLLARLPLATIHQPRWNLSAGFAYCLLIVTAWAWGLTASASP